MSEHIFKVGDKVTVKHQKELGVMEVKVSREETSLKRIGGEPVGFYIRVGEQHLGYHASSLEFTE